MKDEFINTAGELKQKGIKGIKRMIYSRTIFIIFAFIIQFVWLTGAYVKLKEYSLYVYSLFAVIGIVVILHLYNGEQSPEFKMVWILPILIFPVFGSIFYLYILLQPGTKMIKRRLDYLSNEIKPYLFQNSCVENKLLRDDIQMSHLAAYLEKYNSCPVYENTSAKYYALGEAQYQDILEELMKAEKFIFLEFFIVQEGIMWNSILEILKEKVKQGVEVRVMYDGMCVMLLLPYFYPKLLQEEGIRCKMFSPITPLFSSHYNYRDHRKILVIDGKVAFTGGTNLADEYINKKKRFGHWKDTAIMLQGKAVEKFTYLFLEMWNITETKQEDYEKYKTPEECTTMSNGYFIPYGVSPFGEERIGKRVYLDIINTAKKYVHIMTPYLIPDFEMLSALLYAAKRGIHVEIIMPHVPDKKYAFILAKTYYNQLLDAGVFIYEYLPGFVHAKVFVSDNIKAVVGTINMDYRSMYHHFECGVLLYKNSEIKEIEADYQETLKKCQKITKEDYWKQNFLCRFWGKLLRMIAPFM